MDDCPILGGQPQQICSVRDFADVLENGNGLGQHDLAVLKPGEASHKPWLDLFLIYDGLLAER